MMIVASTCREKMIQIRKKLDKVGKDKYDRNNKELNGNNEKEQKNKRKSKEKDKDKRKRIGRCRCRGMKKHAFVSKNKCKLREEKNSSKIYNSYNELLR